MPPLFNPPLSVQRYLYVENFLRQNPGLASITDVGCGVGKMVRWLKTVETLEHANFLDSEYPLEMHEEQDRYLRPPLLEAVFGRKCSDKELFIHVFTGDVVIPDERLKADVFSLVEMIEHVSLEKVETISKAVFGYYQPKHVVVTTPNTEVNPLLSQLGSDQDNVPYKPKEAGNTFRHSDHKFEWTRAEFNQWAQYICSHYNYSYHLDGVGHLPGSEPFGPATQIAVFTRKSEMDVMQSNMACSDLMLNRLLVNAPESFTIAEKGRNFITLVGEYSIPGNKWPPEQKLPPWDLVDSNGVDHYVPTPGDPYYDEIQKELASWSRGEDDDSAAFHDDDCDDDDEDEHYPNDRAEEISEDDSLQKQRGAWWAEKNDRPVGEDQMMACDAEPRQMVLPGEEWW